MARKDFSLIDSEIFQQNLIPFFHCPFIIWSENSLEFL